jgi:hypothetical protein
MAPALRPTSWNLITRGRDNDKVYACILQRVRGFVVLVYASQVMQMLVFGLLRVMLSECGRPPFIASTFLSSCAARGGCLPRHLYSIYRACLHFFGGQIWLLGLLILRTCMLLQYMIKAM